MLFILLHLIWNILFSRKKVHFAHKPRKSTSSGNVEEANSRAHAIWNKLNLLLLYCTVVGNSAGMVSLYTWVVSGMRIQLEREKWCAIFDASCFIFLEVPWCMKAFHPSYPVQGRFTSLTILSFSWKFP